MTAMTSAQARIASGLELSLPELSATLGPTHTVPALMVALEAALSTDQMRDLSRLLDRKADDLERQWRATSAPDRS